MRFILTVSPVPLTATASGNHVLPATTYSKSVLRAVAGHLAEHRKGVDYFPSFEIITNQAARGTFFEPNLRSVRNDGVDVVMKTFFANHKNLAGQQEGAEASNADEKVQSKVPDSLTKEDIQCEESQYG